MSVHSHVHEDGQPHDSHGGSRGGLVFDLLDALMLGAFIIVCGLLAELAWKAWQQRQQGVRFDLTPEGRAATDPTRPESLVDLDALADMKEPEG